MYKKALAHHHNITWGSPAKGMAWHEIPREQFPATVQGRIELIHHLAAHHTAVCVQQLPELRLFYADGPGKPSDKPYTAIGKRLTAAQAEALKTARQKAGLNGLSSSHFLEWLFVEFCQAQGVEFPPSQKPGTYDRD